jgi:hypothetical protein
MLEQEMNPKPEEPTEEIKSPVQIHAEETLALASRLFLAVRQWLGEN